MSLCIETGQSLRDYVLVDPSPERITELIGRTVKSADKNNPQHGTIIGFAVDNDPEDFIIEWEDGHYAECHWNNRFVTLVEVL